MKITISDNRLIEQVQDEFSKNFPFLKIGFFNRAHRPGQGTAFSHLRSHQKTIGECRTLRNEGELIINPKMTVAELEQKFREIYGLNVQVFRKSGAVWLETTVTDGWTLEQQNIQGEALSRLSCDIEKAAN